MINDRLSIELEPRTDDQGRKYFVGKLKGPITIDCENGVAFLIFVSEEGAEELQVCNIQPPKSKTKYEQRHKKF